MSSVIFYLKVQLAVDIVSSSTWDDEFSVLMLHATCWVCKSQVVFPVSENSWNKQVLWILRQPWVGYGVTSWLWNIHKGNFLKRTGSVWHKHLLAMLLIHLKHCLGQCHCHQKLNYRKRTCQSINKLHPVNYVHYLFTYVQNIFCFAANLAHAQTFNTIKWYIILLDCCVVT